MGEPRARRRIRKLTSSKSTKIGIYKNSFSQNQILDELLKTQYETEILSVDDTAKLKDLNTLIVIDDGSQESTASALINNYLKNNGKVLLLESGVSVNPQSLSAEKSVSAISGLLADYGVTLNKDLVFDPELSEILSFADPGGQRYLTRYPYWLQALPATEDFAPLNSVKSISLGWPSSLTLSPKEGISQKILLNSSPNAGKKEDNFDISPASVRSLKSESPQKFPLSVLVEKGDMRLVIVSSAALADDQFLEDNSDNLAFLSNTVDYLAADKDLSSIPSKSSGRAVFEFKSPLDLLLVQYGNLLIPPLVVTVFAVFYLRRRTSLTRRNYVRQES